MITFSQKGNFSKLNSYFQKKLEASHHGYLDKYGRLGVEALKNATPVDTGLTADSWTYTITREDNKIILGFDNTNVQRGIPIAVILQYGHATKNGGWVEGRDYINPSIRPIFDEIAKNAWEEVSKA